MESKQLALLIPIIISLSLFALIFGIVYLRNKERMARIEHGLDLNADVPTQSRSNLTFSLTSGLLLIGAGLGLFIAYMMDHFALSDEGNPAIYFSLIAFFGGLGLFSSYFIEMKVNQKKEL